MPEAEDRLLAVFKAADEINRAIFHDGGDPYYLSLEDLSKYVSDAFSVEIKFKLIDVEVLHVFGFIERYGDKGQNARIYIVKNILPRQKRLVGAKEVCQIVVDRHEDFSTNGQDTLERLVTPTFDLNLDENNALRSEYFAEALSWELLYPFELRKKDKAELAAGKVAIADLGARYGIPNQIVEVVLTQAYLDLCQRYWTLVDREHRLAAMRRGALGHGS